jgi:hypothetical protein
MAVCIYVCMHTSQDAEDWQVRRGKRMMYRLTKRLLPYIQRKDESILRALLPPKEELVLFVRCTYIYMSPIAFY